MTYTNIQAKIITHRRELAAKIIAESEVLESVAVNTTPKRREKMLQATADGRAFAAELIAKADEAERALEIEDALTDFNSVCSYHHY